MAALIPGESERHKGLRMRINLDRVSQFFDIDRNTVFAALPPNGEFQQLDNGTKKFHSGFVADRTSLDRLIGVFSAAKQTSSE